MSDMEQMCSLSDTAELRKLIIEDPDLPLMVFCGEEAWSGEYGYEQAGVKIVGIREMTLFGDYWLDRDDYRDGLADNLSDKDEYKGLSDREYDEMIDRKVQEAEFVKAIVIYVG